MRRRPFRNTGPLLTDQARELLQVIAVVLAAALVAVATAPPADAPVVVPDPALTAESH